MQATECAEATFRLITKEGFIEWSNDKDSIGIQYWLEYTFFLIVRQASVGAFSSIFLIIT